VFIPGSALSEHRMACKHSQGNHSVISWLGTEQYSQNANTEKPLPSDPSLPKLEPGIYRPQLYPQKHQLKREISAPSQTNRPPLLATFAGSLPLPIALLHGPLCQSLYMILLAYGCCLHGSCSRW